MAYELGSVVKFSSAFTAPIGIKNPANAYDGFRAYARRKDGKYQEVLSVWQESGWVQGINEGAFNSGPFDTKEEAAKAAKKAHQYLNR
jgi:hypothetical protein